MTGWKFKSRFSCWAGAVANGSRYPENWTGFITPPHDYSNVVELLSNQDEFDYSWIALPGVNTQNASGIVSTLMANCENRGDCMAIVDMVNYGAPLSTVNGAANNYDSSYGATYWPWVKIIDITRNKPVWVPPSAVLPGVFAFNDTVAFEWFAPAGLNRGGISEAVDVEQKLTFSQRDVLYENKINPLATFPNQGVCVWGQKTLQSKPSALDRINVRRLMISLKKYIASATRYLVFENNTTETRQRFLNIVNPYLERVKSRQGLYAFRVVMDETNNTPDVIDRNQMYGQIFLQPARSSEFIILDFNILPTGASFENA
jgi:phage tail sheath protein FI